MAEFVPSLLIKNETSEDLAYFFYNQAEVHCLKSDCRTLLPNTCFYSSQSNWPYSGLYYPVIEDQNDLDANYGLVELPDSGLKYIWLQLWDGKITLVYANYPIMDEAVPVETEDGEHFITLDNITAAKIIVRSGTGGVIILGILDTGDGEDCPS